MAKRNSYNNKNSDRNGKRPYNGKGQSKRGRNVKDKFNKVDEEAVISEKEVEKRNLKNDPNWYVTDKDIADQVSMLSWNRFLGIDGPALGSFRVPDTMSIRLNPCPGVTPTPGSSYASLGRSGFNMTATKLFNRLSMKSGRNMAYQPQDVGTMLLAQGELLSMISHIKRLFGVAQVYNMRNRMFPKDFIRVLGIDADDFFDHFSDYRTRVNTALASVNKIPILTNSGYFRKCATLYDNVYTDTDNPMAQIYVYIPHTTWLIDETSYSGGTILKTIPAVPWKFAGDRSLTEYQTAPETFQSFLSRVFLPMIDALLNSSTLNLVYADLLNLADREDISFFKFTPITEDVLVLPTHDTMVLKQIHNSVAVGEPMGGFAFGTFQNVTPYNDVYPDASNNCIIYNPGFADLINYPANDGIFIDTDSANPDSAERIEITRFTSVLSPDRTTLAGEAVSYNNMLPDHYVVFYEVYRGSTQHNTTRKVYKSNVDVNETVAGPFTENVDWLEALLSVQAFDWMPIIYFRQRADGVVRAISSDLCYYTVVDYEYLNRINQILFMGLFELR